MKDYQIKKTDYHLRHNVYMQTLYIIRDYKNIQAKASAIILEQASQDGQPKGNGVGQPTEPKAIRRECLMEKLNAMDEAIQIIPEEYRKGILQNIINRKSYPDDASASTYSRWRQRFIFEVAERLNLN